MHANREPASSVSRRTFLAESLAAGTACASGLLAQPLDVHAHVRAPRGPKRLVVIYLEGGNDGLNSAIPTGLTGYFDRRPTLAIPESKSLSLDSGPAATTKLRFHPALAALKQLWDKGNVAIVQKVGYPDPNLSHFLSLDVWGRGTRAAASSGWLARLQDAHAVDRLSVIGLGTRSQLDFRGSKSPALLIETLDRFKAKDDPLYRDHGRFRQQIVASMLHDFGAPGARGSVRDASKLGFETVELLQSAIREYRSTVEYGRAGISERLREAAMLIQKGFSTRVFYAKDGGYDTHAAQGGVTGRHADLLGRVDTAIGAFARDVENMGAWNDTVIVVVSEFGRRNYENGSKGTDHGTANAAFVIGGGVRGGVYGPDLVASDLAAKFPDYEIDFRSIYRELIGEHLGFDPKPVFPEKQDKETQLGLLL